MDIVFYFHFYAHNNDFTPARSLAFYATHINTTWDKLDHTIACCAEDMDAQYGEHCGLVSSKPNMIGYSSSDIEGPLQDQVMQAWRSVFANHFIGCVVGDVFDVTHVKNDAQIYECTKDAYEHQQAQQLRGTLNAHITPPVSPAAAKKI